MKTEIKVHVIDYGRKNLYMRYVDPVTGKQSTRSTGTHKRKEAERIAHKWEAELQEGRYKAPSKVGWAEFRIRYEDEVLPGFADRTAEKVWAVFNTVERYLKPEKLANLTAERISYLMSKMREAGRAETTIKSNMAHLKACLNWAKRVGLLTEVPNIDMPRRAKGGKIMKGRPITGEEFERLLSKVQPVLFPKRKKHSPIGPDPVEQESIISSWKELLVGLWWSGLRLEESLELWWDRDDKLCVDLTGKFPMLHIPAELEKGNRDRLLPIAPEFAEFLQAKPEHERTGRVFEPKPTRPWQSKRLGSARVGRIISGIGEAANVKVHTDPKTGKVKYASAHDLRRSFGERWAPRVMPQVLMEMMRHESIETTLKFYVGRNAQNTAEVLYAALGNTLGNTTHQTQPEARQQKTENPVMDKTFGE